MRDLVVPKNVARMVLMLRDMGSLLSVDERDKEEVSRMRW